MYKEDLRIQKTRRDLRKSIMDLIKVKSIDSMTVTEICNNALINRMTFYKYYEDKYQLLEDAVLDIMDDLTKNFPEFPKTHSVEAANKYNIEVHIATLKLIRDNLDLMRILLKNGNSQMKDMLLNVISSGYKAFLTELGKNQKLDHPIGLDVAYLTGGFYYSLNYWIDHPDIVNDNVIETMIKKMEDTLIQYNR